MRKHIYIITLLTGILVSCSENKAISEIHTYIKDIKTRTDLKESYLDRTREWTDKNGKLYRIISRVDRLNDTITNFEFYYKNEKLIYGKGLILVKTKNQLDTISHSEIYVKNENIIKQIHKKPHKLDTQMIQLFGESFIIKGLGTE